MILFRKKLLHKKDRLTYRLWIFVHGFLECCGNPQCTQECGPSFLKESSSTRRSSREKQRMRTEEKKKGRIYRVTIQLNDANAGGIHINSREQRSPQIPRDTDFMSKARETHELHTYDKHTTKPNHNNLHSTDSHIQHGLEGSNNQNRQKQKKQR